MDFKKLEEIAKDNGRKIGFMRKSIYRMMAQAIPDDANIVMMTEGLSGPNPVPVVLTDTHIYMMSHQGAIGVNAATIKREKVTDVETSGSVLMSVAIQTPGKGYQIDKVPMQDAQRLASELA